MRIYLRWAPLKELGIFIGPSMFPHPFKKSDLASPLLTANQRDGLYCILYSLPWSPLLHGQPPSPYKWNPGYCALEPLPARTVVFNEIFQENVPWPPRSPDFSVCDFFWWGLLTCKSLFYEDKSRTLEDLNEVCRLYREQLADVMSNFEKCLKFADKEDFWIVTWCFFQNIVKWNGILSHNISC